VRALVITFVTTLLSFAVCLFVAIIGTALIAKVRGSHPDMTLAYRHVAVPVAAGIAAIVLISAMIMEIRRYRQAKTLAQIERASR
jgi:TRAP-type C4-dicarboxylate transport system permease small subunit